MRALVGSGHRLLGVDVARALALVGMMSVHIFPAVRADGSLHPAYVVAAGRSAALFAVLAGVGIALSTGASTPPAAGDRRVARAGLLARAALLLALGLLLGRVDSPPLVILAYYGLLFVLALPFLGLRAPALFALAGGCALASPVVSQLWRLSVTPTPIAEPGGRDVVKELFLTGTYPALTWTTYLFLGLALGRCDLRRPATAARLAAGGLAVAVLAKLASAALVQLAGGVARLHASLPQDSWFFPDTGRSLREGLYGSTPTGSWRWLLVSAPHSGATLDLVHTSATSAAVLGGCLFAVARLPRGLVLPLAATGSMTLTLYTAHVLAVANGSRLLLDDPLHLWLAHVCAAVVLATAWRLLVGRGPLEFVLARASEGARWLAGRPAPAAPLADSVRP